MLYGVCFSMLFARYPWRDFVLVKSRSPKCTRVWKEQGKYFKEVNVHFDTSILSWVINESRNSSWKKFRALEWVFQFCNLNIRFNYKHIRKDYIRVFFLLFIWKNNIKLKKPFSAFLFITFMYIMHRKNIF